MARIAPATRVFLLVPNFHAPRVSAARLKCRPSVSDPINCRARNHSGIPENRARRSRATSLRRHLNPICGLAHRVKRFRRCNQLPGKCRMRIRDSQRFALAIAAQIHRPQQMRCGRSRGGKRTRNPQKGSAAAQSAGASQDARERLCMERHQPRDTAPSHKNAILKLAPLLLVWMG